MASSCQQSEWLRVAVLAATVAQPHVKKAIDPIKIIPRQYRPKHGIRPEKSQELIDHESPRAWKALDTAFSHGGKPKTYVIQVGGK